MRETIQRLIEAEDEAKRRVQTARQESDQMIAAARRRAADIVAHARAEAVEERARIVDRACCQARLERERLLAETASRLEREVRLDRATSDRAVEAIVRRVCGL